MLSGSIDVPFVIPAARIRCRTSFRNYNLMMGDQFPDVPIRAQYSTHCNQRKQRLTERTPSKKQDESAYADTGHIVISTFPGEILILGNADMAGICVSGASSIHFPTRSEYSCNGGHAYQALPESGNRARSRKNQISVPNSLRPRGIHRIPPAKQRKMAAFRR